MPSHRAVESVDAGMRDAGSDDGDPDSIHSVSEFPLFHSRHLDLELIERSPDRPVWHAAADLSTQGFAHLTGDGLDPLQLVDFYEFGRAFQQEQDLDPEPGERWRSYSAFQLIDGRLSLLAAAPYVQSKQYNQDDGDKLRSFRPIDNTVLASKALRELIRFNVSVARLTHAGLFLGPSVTIGVHMISYRPSRSTISYSSPVWLHKDQEEYVAVILCGLSGNLDGGENILSPGGREISAKLTLTEPLDMLLLSRKGLHAVVPMKSTDGRPAFRNVLLITLTSS